MNGSRVALVGAGVLILFESFLIFAPLTILGGAIDWPASLDFAPSKVLPLIVEQRDAVRLGYGIYLGYSLLFAPVGVAIAWLAVRGTSGERSVLLSFAIALAVASALARAIGIIRWLAGSLSLGDAWLAAEDPSVRAALEAAQLATNGWGGAVGELLGVALVAGLWLGVVAVLILRHGALPRWLGWSGLAVALLVAMPAAELVGVSPVSVSVSSSVLHLWFLAVGVVALLQARRAGTRSDRPRSPTAAGMESRSSAAV